MRTDPTTASSAKTFDESLEQLSAIVFDFLKLNPRSSAKDVSSATGIPKSTVNRFLYWKKSNAFVVDGSSMRWAIRETEEEADAFLLAQVRRDVVPMLPTSEADPKIDNSTEEVRQAHQSALGRPTGKRPASDLANLRESQTDQLVQMAKDLMKQAREEDERRQQEERIEKPRVEEFVRQHPGATIEELSAWSQLPVETVVRLSKGVRWLILGDAFSANDEICTLTEHEQRVLEVLQIASQYESPLSTKSYDRIRSERQLGGVGSVRIQQMFGSWTKACDLEGVASPPSNRSNYSRSWSEEDLKKVVADFLVDPEYRGSINTYEQWRRSRSNANRIPSLQTLKNSLGLNWSSVRSAGLMALRSVWISQVQQ
jgi:hypothetical protein